MSNSRFFMTTDLKKYLCLYFCATMMFFFFGCSHQLEVKNIAQYQVPKPTALKAKRSIGIVPSTENASDTMMVNSVADSLRRSCDVVMPYTKDASREVDYIADINLKSSYDGSGVNFLITWPGFLIFAPVWNGYNYEIKHDFNVKIDDVKTNKNIPPFTVHVLLDIRHADFDRTFWSMGGGWLMPGLSAVALIAGPFHTMYDTDVTPLAAEKAASSVGEYVAQEIIKRINSCEDNVIEPSNETPPAQSVEPTKETPPAQSDVNIQPTAKDTK
jgi:hypothetical protein